MTTKLESEISLETIKKVEDKFLYWMGKFQEKFGTKIPFPNLKIKIPSKKTRAGEAAGSHLIVLSPFFLNRNFEDMVENTLPHEIAHCVTDYLYPHAKQGHGPEWKSVMKAVGLTPTRCHNYDVTGIVNRRPRPYKYKCACEGKVFNLTKTIHNKILNGQKRICLKCKTRVYRSVEVSY